MARINIDDSIYQDKRYIDLIIKVKGDREKALGILVIAWTLAQKWFLKSVNRMIPLEEWRRQGISSHIFEVGLATLVDEKWVYVAGSKEQFAWLLKCQQGGEKGGKNRRVVDRGCWSKQVLDNKEENEQGTLKDPKGTQTSSSSSSSLKKENTYGRNYSPVAELLYQKYPKRDGDQRKKKGMSLLEKLITQRKETEITQAIQNYAEHCKRKELIGTDKVKQFATFMSDWEEWIHPPNGQSRMRDLSILSKEDLIAKGFICEIGDEL